jgi:hypothetical protein
MRVMSSAYAVLGHESVELLFDVFWYLSSISDMNVRMVSSQVCTSTSCWGL